MTAAACRNCAEFFARFRCNKPEECDCPKCQGYCACPEPKPELDRRIGGYVIGALTALIIVGLFFDSFVHPLWWPR